MPDFDTPTPGPEAFDSPITDVDIYFESPAERPSTINKNTLNDAIQRFAHSIDYTDHDSREEYVWFTDETSLSSEDFGLVELEDGSFVDFLNADLERPTVFDVVSADEAHARALDRAHEFKALFDNPSNAQEVLINKIQDRDAEVSAADIDEAMASMSHFEDEVTRRQNGVHPVVDHPDIYFDAFKYQFVADVDADAVAERNASLVTT